MSRNNHGIITGTQIRLHITLSFCDDATWYHVVFNCVFIEKVKAFLELSRACPQTALRTKIIVS